MMVQINKELNKLEPLGEAEVYRVPSKSRSDISHLVLVFPSHRGVICSCEGFQYSGNCWHSKQAPRAGAIRTGKGISLCTRCNRLWPDDPKHPGYPEMHPCTEGN